MLSQKVINKVLDIGFYFDDEFDFVKNEVVLTQESREWFKNNLGIKILHSAFVDYFSFAIGGNGKGEELYTLEQVLEGYKDPSFWWKEIEKDIKEKYPNASKRYLQFTSIEGGGSYFYDGETDYVYNVDWGEEEAMITGEKVPWFTSFYDFLEWYYSEESE